MEDEKQYSQAYDEAINPIDYLKVILKNLKLIVGGLHLYWVK